MWFLVGGLVLLGLWWADIGTLGQLHWGWVVLPFVLAAAWWTLADALGFTQRRAVDKMEARKIARRERDMKALGLDVQQAKRVRVMRDPAQRAKPASAAPKKGAAPPADAPKRDPKL